MALPLARIRLSVAICSVIAATTADLVGAGSQAASLFEQS
jgi:hypothetical protein